MSADKLRESLLTGLLFGDYNEPLNDYGKRIVRVIIAQIEEQAKDQRESAVQRTESALSGRAGENGSLPVLPDGDAAERRVGTQSHVESAEVAQSDSHQQAASAEQREKEMGNG